MTRTVLHATLVARRKDGLWSGMLLRGASGSGKSDLALRLLDRGWRLAADDRVAVWRDGACVYGRAPEVLSGLIELRGQGVFAEDRVIPFARIALVVDCVAAADSLERTPEPSHETLLGVAVARILAQPLEPSAPARLDRLFALA